MKFITPIILIAVAISVFFVFITPTYNDLAALRKDAAAYDEALSNSKALENERDKLTAKYNTLSHDDLGKLEKLLPDNVDNIRLILEIEQLASPYGMALRNVQYNSTEETANNNEAPQRTRGAKREARKDFGALELEFNTSGTYADFTSFLRDLENNLRIVDVTSVMFSSGTGQNQQAGGGENYEYTVKIKTYWLKN